MKYAHNNAEDLPSKLVQRRRRERAFSTATDAVNYMLPSSKGLKKVRIWPTAVTAGIHVMYIYIQNTYMLMKYSAHRIVCVTPSHV